MVDDTPSKLRAQPYSLIAAPSYLYPFGPGSIQTTRSLMDQFLLALVGMLDSLLAESNFAAFIKSMRWYDKDEGTNEVQTAKEMRRWMNEGLEVLRKAEVPVEVEGRGLVPGVKGTENEPRGVRTAPVVVKKGEYAGFRENEDGQADLPKLRIEQLLPSSAQARLSRLQLSRLHLRPPLLLPPLSVPQA